MPAAAKQTVNGFTALFPITSLQRDFYIGGAASNAVQ